MWRQGSKGVLNLNKEEISKIQYGNKKWRKRCGGGAGGTGIKKKGPEHEQQHNERAEPAERSSVSPRGSPRMPSGGNEEACTEDVQNKEIQMQMILSGKSFLFSFFVKETRDLTTFFRLHRCCSDTSGTISLLINQKHRTTHHTQMSAGRPSMQLGLFSFTVFNLFFLMANDVLLVRFFVPPPPLLLPPHHCYQYHCYHYHHCDHYHHQRPQQKHSY